MTSPFAGVVAQQMSWVWGIAEYLQERPRGPCTGILTRTRPGMVMGEKGFGRPEEINLSKTVKDVS